MEEVVHTVGCYNVGVHYPRVVPLEPEGGVGRPITVWIWKAAPCGAPVGSALRVLFYIRGDGLVFTDEEGREVAHILTVPLGAQEPDATREIIYVRRKPGGAVPGPVDIEVKISAGGRTLPFPEQLEVRPEGVGCSMLRHIGDLLLGTPAVTVLSAFLAVVKFWQDERERQRKEEASLRDRIERLLSLPPSDVGIAYLEIKQRVKQKRLDDLQMRLDAAWQKVQRCYPYKPWLFQVRRYLSSHYLSESEKELDLEGIRQWLEDVQAADLGIDEGDVYRIESLVKRMRQGEISPGEDLEHILALALDGFRTLGLESTGHILEWIWRSLQDCQDVAKDAFHKVWYEEGGAAGRFLLHRMAEVSSRVRAWMTEWERESPPPPRRLAGPCLLWSLSLPDVSLAHRQAIKYLGKTVDLEWYTPFGPEKGEEDPRLPQRSGEDPRPVANLFWAKHPLWEEILSRRSGFFVAPPGSGRTTFLWMARHKRHFWGMKPSLSLHIPLEGAPKKEVMAQRLSDALGESLLCTLAEDPFWLLGAQRRQQEALCSFLLGWAGGHGELLRRLSTRGLDGESDADARLLWELFLQYPPTSPSLVKSEMELLPLLETSRELLGEAARYRSEEPFAIFIWVDLRGGQEDAESKGWIELIRASAELRRAAFLKVFTPVDVPSERCFCLSWEPEHLQEMLKHRWETVGFEEERWHQIQKFRGQENLVKWLVGRANGKPSRLIREGNQLLEDFGRSVGQRSTQGTEI